MSMLNELYQEVILEHNKSPKNFRTMELSSDYPTYTKEGYNPLCGDHFYVHVMLNENKIHDIAFQGSGCAISKASGSIMTAAVKGKYVDEAEKLFQEFHDMVMSDISVPIEEEKMGKLAVFGGVREFPMRIKCATLCWHAMKAAINGEDDTVTTE